MYPRGIEADNTATEFLGQIMGLYPLQENIGWSSIPDVHQTAMAHRTAAMDVGYRKVSLARKK